MEGMIDETVGALNRWEIAKDFKCQGCLTLFSPPVRLCKKGHCVCRNCSKILKRCGVCGSKFSHKNYFVFEDMLGNASITCAYRRGGCSAVVLADDRIQHEIECAFRPVKCDLHIGLQNCDGRRIKLRNYKEHLIDMHLLPNLNESMNNPPEFFVNLQEGNIVNDGNGLPVVFFEFDEEMFIIRSEVNDGTFSCWCSIVGTDEKAKNYRISIAIQLAPGTLVWKDVPVMSPHVQCLQDLEGDEHSASMSLTELENHWYGNSANPGLCNYSFEISYLCSRAGANENENEA